MTARKRLRQFSRPGGHYLPLGSVGNTLYFRAFDEAYGVELWKSDGTPGGTAMVKDINAAAGGNCGGPTRRPGRRRWSRT